MSIGRFNERYHIKGHLSAGAHGVIFAATDRTDFASYRQCSNNEAILQINQTLSSPSSRHGIRSYSNSSSNISIDLEHESANNNDNNNDINLCDYAIKRIFVRNKIMPLSVLREIKTLEFLRGSLNVIELLDVIPSGSSINLVFPLAPANLTTLIYKHKMSSIQVALYSRMLLEGVAEIHKASIVHRDLKPSNLLIDWNGILKITDFGQARAIEQNDNCLTHKVSTRWYRSPELLYGSNRYDYSVDLWSVGVIIGEMATEWPLFKGNTDIEQLSLVVRALGEPDDKEWIMTLPDYNKIQFVIPPEEIHNAYQRWMRSVLERSKSTKRNFNSSLVKLLSKLCRYTSRTPASELLEGDSFINSEKFIINTDKLFIKPNKVKHLSAPMRNLSSD